MLGDAFMPAQGITPDYASPDALGEVETALAVDLPEIWKYDVLIGDEGQDFSIVRRDILQRVLKDGGRARRPADPAAHKRRVAQRYGLDACLRQQPLSYLTSIAKKIFDVR